MDYRQEWKLYHNAIIPRVSHMNPDVSVIESGVLWKEFPKALFIKYTTDFDCYEKTKWWYVIKDEPIDLDQMNSKRRYEINKGKRNFYIRQIDSEEYKNEMYIITQEAYSAWPSKYRPQLTETSFSKLIEDWRDFEVYGAFSRETDELCAYGMIRKNENWADFCVLHSRPKFERKAINAALVYGILLENHDFLSNGGCICDGNRTIRHETAFQDYLEKYFGFRKAYCHLHLVFRPGVAIIVDIIYPFRHILSKFDQIGIIHNINSVLTMKSFIE